MALSINSCSKIVLALLLFFSLCGNAQKLKITEIKGFDLSAYNFSRQELSETKIIFSGRPDNGTFKDTKYFLMDLESNTVKALDFLKRNDISEKIEDFFVFNNKIYCLKVIYNKDNKNYDMLFYDLADGQIVKKLASVNIPKGERASFNVMVFPNNLIINQVATEYVKSVSAEIPMKQEKIVAFQLNTKFEKIRDIDLPVEFGKGDVFFKFASIQNEKLTFTYKVRTRSGLRNSYNLAMFSIDKQNAVIRSDFDLGVSDWMALVDSDNGESVQGFFTLVFEERRRFPSGINYYEFDAENKIVLKNKNSFEIKDEMTRLKRANFKESSYSSFKTKEGNTEFYFELIEQHMNSQNGMGQMDLVEYNDIVIVTTNKDGKLLSVSNDERNIPPIQFDGVTNSGSSFKAVKQGNSSYLLYNTADRKFNTLIKSDNPKIKNKGLNLTKIKENGEIEHKDVTDDLPENCHLLMFSSYSKKIGNFILCPMYNEVDKTKKWVKVEIEE